MHPIQFSIISLFLPSFLATAASPNIIFILADDLGYSDIEPYGQKQIQTPHLSRLAQEGMLFTDAYAGNSLCGPSRSALLLGLHSGHNPVRHNPAKARGWDSTTQGDPPLPDDALTFARVLKEAGYTTACFGKWGMGMPGQAGSPKRLGFDTFYGYATHVEAHDYRPEYLWRNDEKVPLDGETYTHDLFTSEALSYIQANRKYPFFLYLSYPIPHGPLDPPSMEPYESESWLSSDQAYAAMITRMDADIGKIVLLLHDLKIEDNTLVIFTSDNGPSDVGPHKTATFNSTPFRGAKGSPYEGGLRVPLLARWPETIPPGTRFDLPICFYDIPATFVDLVDKATLPADDGISFLPTLLGQDEEQEAHEYLYWELGDQNDWQAVRKDHWKAIRSNVSQPNRVKVELFDLKDDPKEQRNVASKNPSVVSRMEQIFNEAHESNLMFPLTQAEIQVAPPNIVTPNAKQRRRAKTQKAESK